MSNLDDDIDTIMQILKENTFYSPQARAYVIHGAINKLIEWRDSFLTKNSDMELAILTEQKSYAGLSSIRREDTIVMHAFKIWKGFFFKSPEQAAGVIQSYYPGVRFKTLSGNGLTIMEDLNDSKNRFVIQTVSEFRGMEDIQRPIN